ncbi:MAG: alanine--glyoxylate aminotransferase family protein [Nitrososphaerota archaeon]
MSESKKILMIPGPTEIPWRVIRNMMRPSIAHYDPEFNIDVLDKLLQKMKNIFQTKNEVIAVPGSGRVALEASIASVIEPNDKVLCVEAGVFGAWMTEIVRRIGGKPVAFQVEWGKSIDIEKLESLLQNENFKALTIVHNETSTGAMYPIDKIGELTKKYDVLYLVDTVSSLGGIDIKTDDWNIDLNMSASHKCLAAPIGLALISISKRGWEVMENRKTPSVTFSYDLLRWKKWWLPKERGGEAVWGWRRQPITMPVHLIYALDEAVNMILEEGVENRFKRHKVAAKAIREGIKAIGLELFPDEEVASDTVTAVKVPNGIKDSELRSDMKKNGVVISGGLEKLSGKIFRVAHMGMTASPECVLQFLAALESSLIKLGYKIKSGASIDIAAKILEEIATQSITSPM